MRRGQRKHTLAVPFHQGPQVELPALKGSPDPTDLVSTRKWVAGQPGPRAIDLFCGAGGLSYGLQQAGFSVLVGADYDREALNTHRANVGGLAYGEDLSDPTPFLQTLRMWGVDQVDLIAAGLPCQPFSQAGRSKIRSLVAQGVRHRDDPRVRMWKSFLTIVRALHPGAVLVENVPELAVWQDGSLILELCDELRALGYRTEARVLWATDFGVPQHRRRLFIVGVKAGVSFDWPTPVRRDTTLLTAIGDLPKADPSQREDTIPYAGRPRTAYQRLMRRGLRGQPGRVIHDHITRAVRKDDAKAFRMMPEGGIYKDLPERLRRYRSDIFHDKYKRLSWGEPSRSITAHLAKDGYWYIHPDQHRTLSVREAARIQSFPDRFRFSGTPMHRFRQIGNAVPPLLAEALGRQLLAALARPNTGAEHADPDAFRRQLLRWHARAGRKFPWRTPGASRWKVLMAEVCLHRTRADQVLPVYRKLLRVAPTPAAMLENASEVRRLVKTLGLHWRGRNMINLARTLVHSHGGEVPRSEVELKALPGVGEYVARAVISFAWKRPAVILDTNTRRIVSRVRKREKPHVWQTRLDLYELAGRKGPDAAFNYALLDLGALICRPTNPLCGECPVRDLCAFRMTKGV